MASTSPSLETSQATNIVSCVWVRSFSHSMRIYLSCSIENQSFSNGFFFLWKSGYLAVSEIRKQDYEDRFGRVCDTVRDENGDLMPKPSRRLYVKGREKNEQFHRNMLKWQWEISHRCHRSNCFNPTHLMMKLRQRSMARRNCVWMISESNNSYHLCVVYFWFFFGISSVTLFVYNTISFDTNIDSDLKSYQSHL